MGTSTCCTSRQPPSPDALSPRPVASPTATPRRVSHNEAQEPVASWSTSTSRFSKGDDNAELRVAIFDPIQELDVNVEVDDEDNEDKAKAGDVSGDIQKQNVEEVQHEVKPMKSSATLKIAMKNRLRKTFSRESGLDKKGGKRSSVGTSEEEIERRKELRRLRHKRIEEELSHECEYDDDAQTMSTVEFSGESCSKNRKKRQSILPEDSGSFPVFRKTPTPSTGDNGSKISLCTALKMDDSKVSVSTIKAEGTSKSTLPTFTNRPTSRSDAETHQANVDLLQPNKSPPRRYSSPGPPPFDLDFLEGDLAHSKRKQSDLPPMPPAPLIEAQRLPSICIPDSHSSSNWRLSYTSHNRAQHLRRLSQQFDVSAPPAADVATVGTRPITRWLKGQGLRSSSQAISNSDCSTAHPEPLFSHPPRSDSGFGGVDGSGTGKSTVHLQDMNISKRLLQSSCSSPQLSSWSKHRRQQSGVSTTSQTRDKLMRTHPSETISIPSCPSISLSDLLPPTWGKAVADNTSSLYPSRANSIQPSPECSRLELFFSIPTNKSKVERTEASVVEESFTPLHSPTLLATPTTANVSTTSLNAPLTRYSARQIDESSLFASETTSFREREVELSHIQARFASSEARRSPSTPISSKFREEFDLPVPVQPSKSPFQKLARLASIKRKSEDTDSDDLLLAPPQHRLGFGYRFSSTPLSLVAKKALLDTTPTKVLEGSGTTPHEDVSDVMDTPVKGKFSALKRIKRLASIGGFDGTSDEPEISAASSTSRLSVGSHTSGVFIAPGPHLDTITSEGQSSSVASDTRKVSFEEPPPMRRKRSSGGAKILGLTEGMASQEAEDKLKPTPPISRGPSHAGMPSSQLHSPHLSSFHSPHLSHMPPYQSPLFSPISGGQEQQGPMHEAAKKVPKVTPAIAPAIAPANSKAGTPSRSHQPGGQVPASEPPQWRGPRAKNRAPGRDQNRGHMDTSQDDSAAVWMKAVKGAVNDRSKARKSLQDEDDIFGDWEAELAGVSSRAKLESRKFGSRGKPKLRQIEQFPPSWCRYPSHEREARGAESAGVNEQVQAKDFAAVKHDVMGKREHAFGARPLRPGFTKASESDELDPILTPNTWHQRLGQKIKIAWLDYRIAEGHKRHALLSGSLGRRGSMTMDGKVPFPELELLPMRAPPPPSEVVDEEADDVEAEKKRVEEIKKAKIKPVHVAMDLTERKAGVSDLLDIFSGGPEEPEEPKMPVKKKGPRAKKVADPYALDDGDDLGAGEANAPKKKKVKDPYALDDDDDELLGGGEEKMPVKKKGKARDPYAIDDDLDGSSDFGDEVNDSMIDDIVMANIAETGEDEEKYGNEHHDLRTFDDSEISSPDYYKDCLVPLREPETAMVHVRQTSGSGLGSGIAIGGSSSIIEEEDVESYGEFMGIADGKATEIVRENSSKRVEKFKTWNGRDWEREIGVWKKRDSSLGRESMGGRSVGDSVKSTGAESWNSKISRLSRVTVKSVVSEVRRLEHLERERREGRKNEAHLTGGDRRGRSASLGIARLESLRRLEDAGFAPRERSSTFGDIRRQ